MLGSELLLLMKRRRTRVLFILLTLAPWLMGYLIFSFGGGKDGGGPNFLDLVTHNAVFLVLASLSSLLPILLPLAVSLVASDAIAGEASTGTLRYLLVAPLSRIRLLINKLLSSLIFVFALVLSVAISGVVAGSIFFPTGRVLTLSGQTISFPNGVMLAMLAAVLVGFSLVSVVAVGMAISSFTDVPVGATLGTLGVVIISEILGNISQVKGIWPMLPTNYWMSFVDLFRIPIPFGSIWRDLLSQVIWLTFGFSLAAARLSTKDITS